MYLFICLEQESPLPYGRLFLKLSGIWKTVCDMTWNSLFKHSIGLTYTPYSSLDLVPGHLTTNYWFCCNILFIVGYEATQDDKFWLCHCICLQDGSDVLNSVAIWLIPSQNLLLSDCSTFVMQLETFIPEFTWILLTIITMQSYAFLFRNELDWAEDLLLFNYVQVEWGCWNGGQQLQRVGTVGPRMEWDQGHWCDQACQV